MKQIIPMSRVNLFQAGILYLNYSDGVDILFQGVEIQ